MIRISFFCWYISNIIVGLADGASVFGTESNPIKDCGYCSWEPDAFCAVCLHDGYEPEHSIQLRRKSISGEDSSSSAIKLAKKNRSLFKRGRLSFAMRGEGPFGSVGYDEGLHHTEDLFLRGGNKRNKFIHHGAMLPNNGGYEITRIPIHRMRESLYIGTISVGTPPQVIQPIFDTGSTNIWVVGTECSSPSCKKVARFDKTKSKTFDDSVNSKKIHIKFGTGEIEGTSGTDTIRIGNMTAPHQSIAIVEDEGTGNTFAPNVFDSIDFEGIVGLAFPEMASVPGLPILDNLAMLHQLKNKEFSFYISDSDDESMILFGGVDPKYFEGKITMFPVVREHYWEVALDAVYVGDYKLCCDEKSYLIFDSGTSLNTLPSGDYSKFISLFPHGECKRTYEGYPTITYVVAGQKITLTGDQYMMDHNGDCTPAYMQLDVPSEFGHAYIVGSNAFMRHYYTVFRRGNGMGEPSMVGIAPAKRYNPL